MPPALSTRRTTPLASELWLRALIAWFFIGGTASLSASVWPSPRPPSPEELARERYRQELAQDQATEILLLQKSRELALSPSSATPTFPVRAIASSRTRTYFLSTDDSLWLTASMGAKPTDYPYPSTQTIAPGRRNLSHVKIADGVESIALSLHFGVALRTDGTASVWPFAGITRPGAIDPSVHTTVSEVQAIAAGDYHRLFLKTDGSVLAQGKNDFGQLGNGSTSANPAPALVMEGVQRIYAAGQHSFFLKQDGSVWAAGDNAFGQLGDGTTDSRAVPVQVLSDVQAVATAETHTLFLKTDGSVWATGYTLTTQTNAGVPAPRLTPVRIFENAKAISAGGSGFQPDIDPGFALILKNDNSVWRTGYFAFGDMAKLEVRENPTPVHILNDIASIHAGDGFGYYIKPDGNVLAEGNDGSSKGLGRGLVLHHEGGTSALKDPIQITANPQTLVLSQSLAFASDVYTPHPHVIIFCRSDSLATDMPLPTLTVVDGPGFLSQTSTGQTNGYWSLHLTGNGTVRVRATHAGTFHYAAAPMIETTIVADEFPQAIHFTPLPARDTTDPVFALSANSSSGLPVTFSVIAGRASLGADGKTLTLGSASGVVTLRATQPGGTIGGLRYAAAEPVEHSFDVTHIPPTTAQKITFDQPTAPTYGDSPLELAASADSGLPVAFQLVSISPPGIASLKDGVLTILGAGKVNIRAVQPGLYPYKSAASVSRTITINKKLLLVSSPDFTRLVRDPNPTDFGLTYVGFVGSDTAANLHQKPVASTKATFSSPAGEYPITLKGGADNNYACAPGDLGTLTVQGFGGAYEALLVDELGVPRGKLELRVPTDALTYSGTLNLASEPASLSIRGSLSASDGASATGSFTRAANIGKNISALSLGFELVGDTLDGELSINDQPALSIGSGSRLFVQSVVAGKKQNAPWVGAHTLVLRDPIHIGETDERPLPLGASHASATIASTGLMTLKGKLADGVTLTGTAAADSTGRYRLYARPYAKRLNSFLSGELNLVEHPDQTRFPNRHYMPEGEATLFWAKVESPAKPLDASYRLGFETEVVAFLDPWIAPATKPVVVNGASLPAGTLPQRLDLADSATSAATVRVAYTLAEGYDFGARADFLPTSLALYAKGAFSVAEPITTPLNLTAFSLKPTLSTGAISGSFVLRDQVSPPPAKPIDRKATFSGTLRQGPTGSDNSIGHAQFLVDPIPGDASTEQISGELQLFAP